MQVCKMGFGLLPAEQGRPLNSLKGLCGCLATVMCVGSVILGYAYWRMLLECPALAEVEETLSVRHRLISN